jgi:dTDP-4-dehydrorhamnose reductase
MINVLILGSDGLLGLAMKAYFKTVFGEKNVTGLNRTHLDFFQLYLNNKLEHALLQHITPNLTAVVNCSGIVKQRQDVSPVEMLVVNTILPLTLDKIVREGGLAVKLVHISSDCVFSGHGTDEGHTAKSMCTAHDLYGISKYMADTALTHTCVIRTSIIGDSFNNGRSLVEWCKSQAGKVVNGFANHHWNGVTTVELARFVADTIARNRTWCGIRQLTCGDQGVTKYELLKLISSVYGLNMDVHPFNDKHAIDRRLHTDICVPTPIHDQVKELHQFFYASR